MKLPDRTRLIQKLDEQLNYIDRSCKAFDQGEEDDAIRIATSLRVIFHHTKNSTSLIAHLSLERSKMLSSSRGRGDFKDYLAFRLHLTSSEPMKCVPLLGKAFIELGIENWWRREPIFAHNGKNYFRREIVLNAANKDGGAHVDTEVDEFYEALAAGGSGLGVTGNLQFHGKAPYEQGVTHFAKNAHLALLRHFAHETLSSAKRFSWPRK